MNKEFFRKKILELKQRRQAAILVHNYQRPEIQDLADFLGDSLDLARRARSLDNPVIVFCGVHFMAESAALLAPDKTVLLPHPDAGCPLADCATPEMVREARRAHPDAVVVAYINTSAAVKAEVDITCTSANAIHILSQFKDREIIYLPDKNLAEYAARTCDLNIIRWPGQCYVHDALIDAGTVRNLKTEHPEAVVMAHPEAPMSVLDEADVVTGTSGMMRHARQSQSRQFIVVTETGLTHRMRREIPGKEFIPVPGAICAQMKLTTLETLYEALRDMQHHITVPDPVAGGARRALERMLELSV
ncbi:MAG TPA: quinolinate synthase NadA [bacterium]|nr:quinolinate synthase NadA [bacterium]